MPQAISRRHRFSIALLVLALSGAAPARLPHAPPEAVGMSAAKLAEIDALVEEGLAQRRMPGCVILVARQGKIVQLKAYGDRAVQPERLPMTIDTLFDMASITKPTATATSVMLLVEQGKLKLDEPACAYWPQFGCHGKERITLRQLLTHQGGLIPDNALADYQDGPEKSLERICELSLRSEPGTRFSYTDVGFIVLGELVRRVSGRDVHAFSQQHVFRPLGMNVTGYLPAESLRAKAALTEEREGHWMQGEVHDPRAYLLGGVAGHAGLFSTAEDLAVYAQMLHGRGAYGGVRVMQPETVELMASPHRVSSGLRALGWDMKTGYSINRGQGFSSRAFGHGGFTGTVLWIDPELQLTFIFLSNRVHPEGKGLVNPLAGRIGTLVAAAIVSQNRPTTEGVLTGIDVLVRDNFAPLKGRRVGLITNHTGQSRDGKSTVELLRGAPDVKLVALFSPEHGFEGKLDVSKIGDASDPTSGLPIYSLYGETRRPTKESLQGLDTLVFDIQDIGARFYTYPSTMALAMEVAAEHGLRFVVLDRPNPINGVDVDGPLLDAGKESFVGFHTIPVRHGLTMGELALLYNRERNLKANLQMVQVEGWRRRDYFDATGLPWINPSPNMRSLTEALLYPGIGLLETTNLSVGRGTNTPFEVLGAPWIDARQLAAELNAADLAGVRFVPLYFMPDSSKFKGERCGGVNVVITNRELFEPLRTGFSIAVALRKLYPQQWEVGGYARLLANEQVLAAVKEGRSAAEIVRLYQDDLQRFHERRRAVLVYP
jgi:uncharacterized protein YbbC (DUF1343 family)